MGLVHFNELFNHDNLLGNAKVPFDKPEGAEILKTITQSTTVLFVDLTFLLTSGRDMKFATPDAFVTDRSDKDLLEKQKAKTKDVEETEEQDEPVSNLNGSYPPMSIDDLVEYIHVFVQNMINTRPSLTAVIFGTDNHVHVPVTKLREWHYRDYHKNSTYETYDGTLRHELRGPFSRTDEGLISNLLNLLEEDDTEAFKQQILGLTFTRADPMLDALLTDRYLRPFFISLLFQRFHQSETRFKLPAGGNKSRQVKVFVMHAIYNFSSFCTSPDQKQKFYPNMWIYTLDSDRRDHAVTDDGLHIGEADLQFLWVLDTKLTIRNKPSFVELLSNDSDMFLIMMNYYYKNNANILNCPYVFIWLSDTRLIRVKHMFTTVVPSMMKTYKLPHEPTSSLFIELCLCFFKNDYVDSPSGLVASLPKFKATLASLGELFEELRKSNKQSILGRNAIQYTVQGTTTKIVFDHFKLIQLRQILMLIGMILVTKKDEKAIKQTLEAAIKIVLTTNTVAQLVASTEGVRRFAWGQFIDKLKMPVSIRNKLKTNNLLDTMNNIIYPLQMTHELQSLCAQYLQNNQNVDIFGKDMANFEFIEPSRSNIWFMSVSDDYGCKGYRGEQMVNRRVGNLNDDNEVAFIDANEQNDLEDDDDGANEIHQTCSKMKKIQEAINATKMLFPGELHVASLSSFAAMAEWIIVYWNFGYFELFNKQMAVGVDVNIPLSQLNQSITVDNTTDTKNTQLWRLLRLSNYKMTALPCENGAARICQIKRDTAIKDANHIKNALTTVTVNHKRNNDNDVYAFVKDQGTVLRRSGVLFIKSVTDDKSSLTKQLTRLSKVCLFRLITLTNTEERWINDYAEQYERLKYEFTLKKGQTQENTEVYPDEHLVLKIVIAKLTTENNLIEPAFNHVKTLTIQGTEGPGTTVLFTPTCVTGNMDNTVDFAGSELYRTRDEIDPRIYRIDIESDDKQNDDVFIGERDVIGELDTCAFTGIVFSTKTKASDKSIEDATAATAFAAHVGIGLSHPFTGTRMVSSLQTIVATTGQDASLHEFIEANKYVMKQRVFEELQDGRLLSCSVDVTDYALPLLKHRIDDDSWRKSTNDILKVFREPMQISYFTFMDWKCNQSIYLRFLLKQNIRNSKTQKWRDNLFLVPAFFQKQSKSFVPINRVEKLSDITKGKVKYWACFPMAYIDHEGEMKAVTDTDSADFIYLAKTMRLKNNHPLRLLSEYIPLCHGIYVNIKQDTEPEGLSEDENYTVTLFFKKIPEHIFAHYIYYTFGKLYDEYMSLILETLQRQAPTLDQFITNPYILTYKPSYQENEEKILQRYSFEFYYYY